MKLRKNMKLGVSFMFLLLTLTSCLSLINLTKKSNTIDENTLSLSAPEDPYNEPNNNWFTAYDLSPIPYDDIYEDNDYDGQAYDLSPWGAMWQYDLTQADEDWYTVYLKPGQERIYAELWYEHYPGTNIDMEIWYNNTAGVLTYLAGSYNNYNSEYIDAVAPWPGFYLIRVFGDNAGNYYDLWWDDLTPFGGGDDPYEQNNLV
ncbi:hypothetical protein LCGC14_1654880, partial [marine sediment metagenome]